MYFHITVKKTPCMTLTAILVPEYLKAIGPKIFELVFRGIKQKIGHGTLLHRWGLPGTSICTENQPRNTF